MSEKDSESSLNGSVSELKFEPKFMDSLDARALQYKYALVKFERLIESIDEILSELTPQSQKVALVHYIIYLASNLFAINESGFLRKLEILENFKVPKSLSVTTSQVVTHVPYDVRDQAIAPLDDLPTAAVSVTCLKAFRVLSVVCQEAYQKRFSNASREIANNAYLEDLQFLFSKSFFDVENDFDLSLHSSLFQRSALVFQVDPNSKEQEDYSEASLIDIDLCSLFSIASETSKMLESHKMAINQYKAIKLSPKSSQESQLKALPHSAYALHRVFFWALRINELYFIVRKFGRQIFISNRDHLYDQKFISFVNNPTQYREMLREIEENFFNTKKNGVLIATITRFLRMDSRYEIKPQSIFDFVGFISQSVIYLDGLLKTLKEFGYLWLVSEVAFRTSHNLPTSRLLELNDIMDDVRVKELKARRLKAQLLAKHKSNQTPSAARGTPTRQQSSAVNKFPTQKPLKSTDDSKKKAESGSIEQTPSRARVSESKSPFYLHKQSSSSSLQSSSSSSSLTEKPVAAPITVAGRRRSNSQPISLNAATTAIKNNGSTSTKQEYTIRSPNESLRRTSLLSKKPSKATAASPLSNKRPVMEAVDEKKENRAPPAEVRKTASQKFQQHLLDASKSGELYGKEKDTFSNVVFDPNNPSATNIRRQLKQFDVEEFAAKANNSASKSDSSSSVPAADQKPTRAQVTRMNTRRNSVVIQTDNVSRLSDMSRNSVISALSQSSTTDSVIIKKVRFTGVPEYTPAEDEPESQSSKILKGFAALKLPAVRHAAVKRKDEAFKQEESRLFKQQLTHGEPENLANNTFGYSTTSQVSLRFTRFKNRF